VILYDNATKAYCRVANTSTSPQGSTSGGGTAAAPGGGARIRPSNTSGGSKPPSSSPPPRQGRLTGSQLQAATSSLVLVCDQVSISGATQLTFTGTQSLQYNGLTLTANSPGQPAYFGPTPSPSPVTIVPGT
jgi:hypothetical protein